MPLEILPPVQSPQPPKGNSFHKKTSHDIQIDKIILPVFAQLSVLPNALNAALNNAFQSVKYLIASPNTERLEQVSKVS